MTHGASDVSKFSRRVKVRVAAEQFLPIFQTVYLPDVESAAAGVPADEPDSVDESAVAVLFGVSNASAAVVSPVGDGRFVPRRDGTGLLAVRQAGCPFGGSFASSSARTD